MVVVGVNLGPVRKLFGLYVGHNPIACNAVQVALAPKAMTVAKGPLCNPSLLAKDGVQSGHSALDVGLVALDNLAVVEALD